MNYHRLLIEMQLNEITKREKEMKAELDKLDKQIN